MPAVKTDKIRTIALLGHGGSGKTSLAEAMLYIAGLTDRLGRTDEGNTVLDFDPEEKRRHVSVATGEGTTSYFYSYDQNYPSSKGEPMTKIKHSYNSFLGVLRPKNQKNIAAKSVEEKAESKPVAKAEPKVVYFKKYLGKSVSLVDALECISAKSSFDYRKKIATTNGIKNYSGTVVQNTALLTKLKKGTLIKP